MSEPPHFPRKLRCHPDTLRRLPHLPGFFPDYRSVSAATGDTGLIYDGETAIGSCTAWITASEAPFRAPRFGTRWRPVALVVTPAAPASYDAGAMATLGAALREGRVGGAAGLADPGPAGLGLPHGEAAVVLDPGHGPRAPRQAMLDAAVASGRPVLCALAPGASRPADDRLAPPPGGRVLPGGLAPWTLIDLAGELHGMGDDTELIAAGAGLRVVCHAPTGWRGMSPAAAIAELAAATRWADPFRGRPWSAAEGIAQLAAWRHAEAENRRIVAATGIEWFKARALRASLAGSDGPPRLFARGSAAIRQAARRGGAAAVWAAVMPPELPARAAAAGVALVRIEDGFIRSAGLGVLLAPAASLVRDTAGIHYDPSVASDLERLLASLAPPAALRERAVALRRSLLATGVTKYNPGGAAESIAAPPGRRVVLVAGQVEDDAAMRRGGQRIRDNHALLEAVRAAEPEAFVVFKPHPDVAAGMRAGAVADVGLADQVVTAAPIAGLYGQADAVHVIGSLAGFEALLRGIPVTVWGRPFYAGWGLTDDRDPAPPCPALPGARRQRWAPAAGAPLDLETLVAAALILYPSYVDPLSGLPCPVEVLVERLAAPARARPHPVLPAALRAFTARCSRGLAGWWAAR